MAVVAAGSPLTARRKLGAELRKLRDRHGLTAEEVGGHLDCHISKVSRLELGKRACTKRDFESLMDLYGVDEAQQAELRELMVRGNQRVPPWWQAYNDVISANYAEFLAYEAEATSCREYQPLLIPAQLQTEGYALAITAPGFTALGPDQVESLTEVRMRRQDRLGEDPPMAFEAVITEAALRLQVGGPHVMRAQLVSLRERAAREHITFRVIPFSAGENGASTGAFTLFTTGQDSNSAVAFTESADAMTFRDDPLTLRRLSRLFRNLSRAALSEQDSHDLIGRIEEELT